MKPVVIVLALIAFVATWHWFLYRKTGGRSLSPLWIAFSTTTLASIFLIAGAAGYRITGGVPFTVPSAWTGRVIWSQILVGTGVALVAGFFWRRGLRSLRTSH